MPAGDGRDALGPRGRARRRALLDAAAALFAEKGYAATTLSDIIERAGGSRATLYEQFGDKAGLFRAMMEESSADILAGLDDAQAEDGATPEAALTAFALHLASALLEGRLWVLRMLAAEGGRIPDVAGSFLRIGPERTRRRLADLLRRLDAEGRLRLPDPDAAARSFMGMVTGDLLLRRLIDPDGAIDRAGVTAHVRQAVALFLRGARP